jgi:hypothetical protein
VWKRRYRGVIGALFGLLIVLYHVRKHRMVTQRRPWPTACIQARDHAMMELQVARHKLRQLINEDGRLSELDELRLQAIALDATTEALRLLQTTVNNGSGVKEE